MQQTSSNSVSSVASASCWGALWAALLADEQVCSGCEPWRCEHGGETDPVTAGCPSCPTALLKGLQGKWQWELLLPHGERVRGPWQLFPVSKQWDIRISPKPSTHSCRHHGGWETTPHHRAQNRAPLLGLLRRTQKRLLCRSQRFGGLAQSKVGCSAPARSSTIPCLLPLTRPSSVRGLSLFGEYPPGIDFIEDLLPLGFVRIAPSQPSERSLQKGL